MCPPFRLSFLRFVFFPALLFVGVLTASACGTDAPPVVPAPAAKARMAASYGKLPLRFEANAGQTDPSVHFVSRGAGYTLFLTSREAVLTLARPAARKAPLTRDLPGPMDGEPAEAPAADPASVVRLEFVGANREPKVCAEEELPTKSNYFIGNDPAKWRRNVANYGRVRFSGIYPGIDLVYYGNQSRLEHDFVVAPGADPKAITLAVKGAQRLHVEADGDLAMDTRKGQLRLLKPVIYQEVDGARREVKGRYVLRAGGRVGFDVAAFDGGKALVIDPVLSYSTYLGGNDYDQANAIAVDRSGSAYVTGWTASADFPTVNPYQSSLQSATSVFISKLSPDGSSLVYSTYLGGGLSYYYISANGIVVDSSGSAYVAGVTFASNFPTTPNAFQTSLQGESSAFVTKLSPDGSSLVFSTFLGGSWDGSIAADNGASGIAVDSGGSAYVTGYTNAINFPTRNAFQSSCPIDEFGDYQCGAFISKFSVDGSSLDYSTYLHGSVPGSPSNSGAYIVGVSTAAIAVDSGGSAYLTGTTESPVFPSTRNAFQSSCTNEYVSIGEYITCNYYAFVTKLTADGSSLAYSTYLGYAGIDNQGGGGTEGSAIAVDSAGSAYITGNTDSENFPTKNAFQTGLITEIDQREAFVTKLGPDGSGLVYSTYLGGSAAASVGFGVAGYGIAVDSSGNAYVTGTTTATDFPTLSPIPGSSCLYGAGFVTKLSPSGSSLVYSTCFGNAINGDAVGVDTGIAVDSDGSVYITGSAHGGLETTPGALQTSPGGYGAYNAFVTKISPGPTVLTVTANPAFRVVGAPNPPFTVTYSGFVNGDTAAVLTGAPSLSTTATPSSPACTYPILVSQGTLSSANYTFKFVNGILTVTDSHAVHKGCSP